MYVKSMIHIQMLRPLQKINAANSWNFALIDYFHDMSLLRNNTDNSINFQRASCTLDGCVKIWTSRVDSVGTETGKLLSNLANEGRTAEDEDEDGHNSDNPDGGDASQTQRKRKAPRTGATLATNVAGVLRLLMSLVCWTGLRAREQPHMCSFPVAGQKHL